MSRQYEPGDLLLNRFLGDAPAEARAAARAELLSYGRRLRTLGMLIRTQEDGGENVTDLTAADGTIQAIEP